MPGLRSCRVLELAGETALIEHRAKPFALLPEMTYVFRERRDPVRTLHFERVEAEGDGCEVVVVDGGSTDGTPEVAAAYPGVRQVRAPRSRGLQLNGGCGPGEAASAAAKALLRRRESAVARS